MLTLPSIDSYISSGVSFAYVILPGEASPLWICENEGNSDLESVEIHFFDNNISPVSIKPNKAEAANGDRKPIDTPCSQSTTFELYKMQATTLIRMLKCTHGKTVLSRLISVESTKKFSDVIADFFNRLPETLRFVYYTPVTGLWFGASPELLFEYDKNTRQLYTMSLAGTRRRSVTGGWDNKNLTEHQFVTDYLMQGLRQAGLVPVIYDSAPLVYGEIEHLCDRIRATSDDDPTPIFEKLSPTPALCGLPRDEAYAQITRLESHQRLCYGGWIGIRQKDRVRAYVVLRCAHAIPVTADEKIYNIYVGGGFTEESDVESEWLETEAKAEELLNAIKG